MKKKEYIRSDEQNIRMQPKSESAEESVLGCILIDNNCYDKVVRHIPDPKPFYFKKHKVVYAIMQSLLKDGVQADVVTILSRIKRDKKQNIDAYWLTGLVENIVTTGNVESHSKIVYEKYLHRQIIKQTYKIQRVAYDDTFGFMELIEKVRDLNEEVMDTKPVQEFDLESLAVNTIKTIGNVKNMVQFGFKTLDSMAGGMTRGEITVIAGRPGHGKTTFSINLVKKLLDQGYKVLVLNREMTNEEMLKKLMVLDSGKLSYHSVRTAKLTDVSAKELQDSADSITNKYKDNLIMYDDVNNLPDTISIISRIRPDVVVDDFIQLIKVPNKTDRRFEIEAVMQEYKWLAKKYKIIPILLSQLNRDIERRIDPIPKMSDLAEGSSIEQTAENVLFIHYDYKVNWDASQYGKMRTQIIAAKVRYGSCGMFTIGVDHDKVLYHEEIPELKNVNDNELIHVHSEDELKQVISKFSPKQESVSFD
jgi:replicative DNA helicase